MRIVIVLLVALGTLARAGVNEIVLEQIRTMPSGGGYATDLGAHRGLAASVQVADNDVRIRPGMASPGYCSGATYLVFLKTLAALERAGGLSLDAEDWDALAPRLRPDGTDTLPDGESVWGRWNANGPGTARLFHELGLGTNFTDFGAARPGDFLKVFWTDAVGRRENGHSVIFLGREMVDSVENVRFWSSNRPDGYGVKSVPRATIARAIFSRLEHPARIVRWRKLPRSDAYLAGLLTNESSFSEAARISGVSGIDTP